MLDPSTTSAIITLGLLVALVGIGLVLDSLDAIAGLLILAVLLVYVFAKP